MGADGLSFLDAEGVGAGFDVAIGFLGRANLLAGGLLAERLIADDAALFAHRRDIGDDPVESAVAAAVFYDALPGAAAFERFP